MKTVMSSKNEFQSECTPVNPRIAMLRITYVFARFDTVPVYP